MRVVQHLEPQVWKEFVDNHPQGGIFHTPEMFQVFARTTGCKPSLWAVVDEHDRPQALLIPVQVSLMNGLLRQFTTRAVSYGSILCNPGSDGNQALTTLLQAYKSDGALFTELRNLSDLSDLQPILNANGFIYEDHLNFLVDLARQPEAILQSMGRRTRKQIGRGVRQNKVIIEEANRPEQVTICYELLHQTYVASQVPLADRSMFEAAFEILHPKGMVKFLLARIEDSYAACSVELLYKDTIYGWYGGMDRTFGSFVPNELLLWHIFKWGAENGFKVYDFGGAGKPDEDYGVRDFKAKFGGELVCYGRNTCIHAPYKLAISKIGYQIYRRLNKG